MKCNLKNNIGKNRDRLSESPNRNKTSILPECEPRRIDEPSLSASIDVFSSSADASVFRCGPVILDFGSNTVHRLSSECLGFNKANDSVTARELRLRDAAHTSETAPSPPTFFSRQRLKRSNVTDKASHKRRKKMDGVSSVLQDCSQSATNADNTNQINGRCLSPKSSLVTSENVVCGYTDRAQPYESAQTSINSTGLPLNSSENDFTRSLYVNEKRKASVDMTTRSLRQCLSGSRSAYAFSNNFSTSSSTSNLNNNCQNDAHHQPSDTTKGLDSSDSPLLPADQTTIGFSQPSRDVPVVLQHTEQQCHLHSAQGASINNGSSSQSTPTSYVAEPVRSTTRRKAPPNLSTRSVRQRLSTSSSQSGSFEHYSQQPNAHQSEDQSLLYEDSPLLPADQTTTGFSQPSRDAPVVLQHTEQQCDLHSAQGTSINNGSSSQSTPTSYVAEPVRSTTRRKAPPNLSTRSIRRRLSTSSQQSNAHQSEAQSLLYEDLGDCNERCRYCSAAFWHGERLKGHRHATYHLCCGGGRVYIESEAEPPDYIRHLLSDATFMQQIRAYNQMFAMTSFGANIDNTVNQGRGPYVFKVSGQVYHQIGSLCPTGDDKPCFLQLYIYDTQNEVQNRMDQFTSSGTNPLDPQTVEGLIEFLDTHNELVQVFRTARDKLLEL
ncbi:hypothetical protein CTI12_AA474270 [Artemisia annua]|uniref:C2H2-type domain-containing protein n=1 Tax=Artemisia annua TaxID=35608 RepID=A0A2U1LMC1_ARTAN|nr:hypothetical protein CTI12_AA474270 [Artemisia annua]